MVESIYKYVNEIIDEGKLVAELEEQNVNAKYKNNRKLANLIDDIKEIMTLHKGSYMRYDKIYQLVTSNELYKKEAMEMSDQELLELITSYISVPMPPAISYEYFLELVEIAKKHKDAREKCFRLFTNFRKFNWNYDVIVDFYIEKRDAWYLMELMSLSHRNLYDVDVIKRVLATGDRKFIEEIKNIEKKEKILSEETLKILKCNF